MNDKLDTPPDAPTEEPHDEAPAEQARMPPEELERVLERHRLWVETDGQDGEQADLSGANLEGANLEGANLEGANLEGANLEGANLRTANLQRASLFRANLQRALLDEANIQNAELVHAYLKGAYLFRANLQGANLFRADLQEAYLPGANLGADLSYANLRGADLRSANFEQRYEEEDSESGRSIFAGNLSGTNLRDADLSDARLSDVAGLQSHQLGGANLSGAQLPMEIAKFEGLDHLEELSKLTRPIFISLIGGCAFSWLTIAATSDSALVTSSSSTPLPNIQTSVPIAGVYWAAPIILLALYYYLHFYLQSLWEELASFPAIFPDGRPLDQRAYPWLLTSLVRAHVPLLTWDRRYSRARVGFSIIAAWSLIPFTLVLIWFRYLPRHDLGGMALLGAAVLVAIWSGIVFYQRAAATLRADPEDGPAITPGPAAPVAIQAALVVVAISATTMVGETRSNLNFFGYSLYANLSNANVSTKPPNWTGIGTKQQIDAQIAEVKPANLIGTDLRLALANSAFLVRANLDSANLQRASLVRANLQGASLQGADLQGADLQGADLNGANLQGVSFFSGNPKGKALADALKYSCQQLSKANNWRKAYRDKAMACGAPIPKSPSDKPAAR